MQVYKHLDRILERHAITLKGNTNHAFFWARVHNRIQSELVS